MRSLESLPHWVTQILPAPPPAAGGLTCAQHAAAQLLRALCVGFTVSLTQLARQLDRPGTAEQHRQYLQRWLTHPSWEPARIQTGLGRCTRRLLHRLCRRGDVLLLVDSTDLAAGWVVLQVSLPWQGRALPLYRAVTQYTDPEVSLPELLGEALRWLGRHLPGRRRRYVLVADRGFPSHPLVCKLQAEGWRFVLRLKSSWKLHHAAFTGGLAELTATGTVGPEPRLFTGGWFGQPQAGRRCAANLVAYWGENHQEPWYLLTSEYHPARVVGIYRQRMQIEQEFRDLKGPLGLDALAAWTARDRVARFLAWLSVYEWRLAYLWLVHRLATYVPRLRVAGSLSWIRTVREWLGQQLRLAVPLTDWRL